MCAENLGRRVVATGGVWIRRSIMDPLTRLAPADESAGCDPPSPPRGRGLGILRIERFVNVETPGHGWNPWEAGQWDIRPLRGRIFCLSLPVGFTYG